MKVKTIHVLLAVLLPVFSGCNFLEPLPEGAYTDENIDLYPQILRGFVDKAYVNADMNPYSYTNSRYIYLTAATDEAIYRNEAAAIARWANGDQRLSSLFADEWTNCYIGINYVNRFLRNREGYNTRYMVNAQADAALRNELQGSAFGLRAWFHFTLLRIFGGRSESGNLLGIPLRTEYTDVSEIDVSSVKRDSYDDCVAQILADCDSAMAYLHENNRDYPDDPSQIITVTGSARYGTLDQIAMQSLKAMTYLLWASPAFNPDGDLSRYEKAAECAAAVITHKIEREGGVLGKFSPTGGFRWTDPNSPEIIWCSRFVQSSALETSFYPIEFGGSAS
ncbi:MAG: RagB/SusD family nutrient uptake outer membrane protein, partial [Bacteroidales bacterium]|nr:RagB/SusD family nutrient uptake outer membrane protein [Bacteroidales bacterium]